MPSPTRSSSPSTAGRSFRRLPSQSPSPERSPRGSPTPPSSESLSRSPSPSRGGSFRPLPSGGATARWKQLPGLMEGLTGATKRTARKVSRPSTQLKRQNTGDQASEAAPREAAPREASTPTGGAGYQRGDVVPVEDAYRFLTHPSYLPSSTFANFPLWHANYTWNATWDEISPPAAAEDGSPPSSPMRPPIVTFYTGYGEPCDVAPICHLPLSVSTIFDKEPPEVPSPPEESASPRQPPQPLELTNSFSKDSLSLSPEASPRAPSPDSKGTPGGRPLQFGASFVRKSPRDNYLAFQSVPKGPSPRKFPLMTTVVQLVRTKKSVETRQAPVRTAAGPEQRSAPPQPGPEPEPQPAPATEPEPEPEVLSEPPESCPESTPEPNEPASVAISAATSVTLGDDEWWGGWGPPPWAPQYPLMITWREVSSMETCPISLHKVPSLARLRDGTPTAALARHHSFGPASPAHRHHRHAVVDKKTPRSPSSKTPRSPAGSAPGSPAASPKRTSPVKSPLRKKSKVGRTFTTLTVDRLPGPDHHHNRQPSPVITSKDLQELQRQHTERLENERLENERLENERLENERLRRERLELDREAHARKAREQAAVLPHFIVDPSFKLSDIASGGDRLAPETEDEQPPSHRSSVDATADLLQVQADALPSEEQQLQAAIDSATLDIVDRPRADDPGALVPPAPERGSPTSAPPAVTIPSVSLARGHTDSIEVEYVASLVQQIQDSPDADGELDTAFSEQLQETLRGGADGKAGVDQSNAPALLDILMKYQKLRSVAATFRRPLLYSQSSHDHRPVPGALSVEPNADPEHSRTPKSGASAYFEDSVHDPRAHAGELVIPRDTPRSLCRTPRSVKSTRPMSAATTALSSQPSTLQEETPKHRVKNWRSDPPRPRPQSTPPLPRVLQQPPPARPQTCRPVRTGSRSTICEAALGPVCQGAEQFLAGPNRAQPPSPQGPLSKMFVQHVPRHVRLSSGVPGEAETRTQCILSGLKRKQQGLNQAHKQEKYLALKGAYLSAKHEQSSSLFRVEEKGEVAARVNVTADALPEVAPKRDNPSHRPSKLRTLPACSQAYKVSG